MTGWIILWCLVGANVSLETFAWVIDPVRKTMFGRITLLRLTIQWMCVGLVGVLIL